MAYESFLGLYGRHAWRQPIELAHVAALGMTRDEIASNAKHAPDASKAAWYAAVWFYGDTLNPELCLFERYRAMFAAQRWWAVFVGPSSKRRELAKRLLSGTRFGF